MEKFSRDLALETQHFGVTVQCVLPSFVATNMTHFKPSLTVPSPKQFVRCSMNTLGLEVSSPGYWVHKIQVNQKTKNKTNTKVQICVFTTVVIFLRFQIGFYHFCLFFIRPVFERLVWYIRYYYYNSKTNDCNETCLPFVCAFAGRASIRSEPVQLEDSKE